MSRTTSSKREEEEEEENYANAFARSRPRSFRRLRRRLCFFFSPLSQKKVNRDDDDSRFNRIFFQFL